MSSGASFNLNRIFNYFNTGLDLEGKDPSCLDGKSLLGRMIVAQNYVEFIKRQMGSEPGFPTLEQCNAIAALFGTTFYGAEEGNFKKIEGDISYNVNYRHYSYLFPIFAQFGFNLLNADTKDYDIFDEFKKDLDTVNWEEPLFSQLSRLDQNRYIKDWKQIRDLRGFLFQALLEIKNRTSSFPEEKQQKMLNAFMVFCLHLLPPPAQKIFTDFGMLQEKELIKSLYLDEEDIVSFLHRNFQKLPEKTFYLPGPEFLEQWIVERSLSAESRLKLASLLLEHSQLTFLQFISYLDVLDLNQSQRFSLLNQHINGPFEWNYLDHFGAFSLNEDQWFELAKKYAEKNFLLFCNKINKFHVTDEKKRAEIALRFAKSPSEMSICIPSLKITDEELLWKVLTTFLQKDPDLFSSIFCITFRSPIYRGLFEAINKLEISALPAAKFGIEEELQPHLESIRKMEKGTCAMEALSWLLRLIACCLPEGISPSEALAHPITAKALEYHEPPIRETFIPKILIFLSDPQQKKYGNKWLETKSFHQHALLPLLCISGFLKLGISEELCDALVKLSKDRIFKDSKNFKLYIQLLGIIAERKEWSEEDKTYLLDLLSKFDPKNPKPLISYLRMIPAVLDLGGASHLTAENLRRVHNNLKKAHFEAFTQHIPLKQSKLFKDFYPLLNDLFRVPNALLTYAGKLNSLPAPDGRAKMLEIFGSFIDTVLTDLANPEAESFRKMRYSLAENQHLHDMFSQHQQIFTQWQENKIFDLRGFIDTPSSSRVNQYDSSQFPKYAGWKIGKTDNPIHLFLCGTEIQSCQSIDYPVLYNVCLMAYVKDGKNAILSIENENGELISRRIFRLLIDKNTRQPVLCMEQEYSRAKLKPELEGLLVELALQTAEEMGLSLVVSAFEATKSKTRLNNLNIKLTKYPGTIVSLGSCVPSEYVDAMTSDGLGTQTYGHFELTDTYLIERG